MSIENPLPQDLWTEIYMFGDYLHFPFDHTSYLGYRNALLQKERKWECMFYPHNAWTPYKLVYYSKYTIIKFMFGIFILFKYHPTYKNDFIKEHTEQWEIIERNYDWVDKVVRRKRPLRRFVFSEIHFRELENIIHDTSKCPIHLEL